MELGEKLRRARLEAGLSQRALCGDAITRNMLSLIESGKARPSMDTLQYLAGRLGRPVGYFLEENTVVSANPACMSRARQAYARRDYAGALEALTAYQAPDELFDAECAYLQALCALALGQERLAQGDAAAAEILLEGVQRGSLYYREEMERRRRQLLQQCYTLLEQHYQQREDYQKAYFYACKRRG